MKLLFMKNSLGVLFLCMVLGGCLNYASNKKDIAPIMVGETPPVYDSVLAKSYEADEYGMKKYVIAFLKTGANKDTNKLYRAEIFRLHMENITRMAENGDLVLAGPFLDNEELRGLYVFNVETVLEAEALTNSDPAVQSGFLKMELVPWYGSAGLMGLNDLHKRVSKPENSLD